MSKPHNIFISWSGQRSRWIAETLRDWLPMIVQAANPWMSATDIDKGSRGLPEITKALDGMKVGITCLTPENLSEPWILYEAGALSKTIDDKTRLCTYLLAGLNNRDVKAPLSMFQHTKAEKEETRSLIRSINKAIGDDPVPELTLNHLFDKLWPDLEGKLSTMPEPEKVVATKRPTEEMVAEILDLTRAEANRRKKTDSLDEYIPVMKDLMPMLAGVVSAAKLNRPVPPFLPEQIPLRPKLFFVKLKYDDEIKTVEGTSATEGANGLIVFNGEKIVARFDDKVERWWTSDESGS